MLMWSGDYINYLDDGGGGGDDFVLLALPAFLPPVISSSFTPGSAQWKVKGS